MVVLAVVDDEASILDAATLLLEGRGWEVRCYTCGEAFLADLARQPACDGLLLDPHLPGISGAEVARAAAERRIPVLALTASPGSGTVRQVAGIIGEAAVLTKPVGAAELLARLDALVLRPLHPRVH